MDKEPIKEPTKEELAREAIIQRARVRQMALATIRRGRDAMIPEDRLRIKEEDFLALLSPDFHKDTHKFASDIYNIPEMLLKRKFITIDGGDEESRLMAGYAILFRMIAYDKTGMYCNCGEVIHQFQSIKSTEEVNRNDLAGELKNYNVLMIGEFNRTVFRPHWESPDFFDEVLSHRVNYSKPTIVTCAVPITDCSKEERAATGKSVSDAGVYLSKLAITSDTTDNVLRIRVKTRK